MSKYIDAEWVIMQLQVVADRSVQSQLYILKRAPSIEIVRCKECKYYKDFDGYFFSTAEVDEDDFCSYGERRDDE